MRSEAAGDAGQSGRVGWMIRRRVMRTGGSPLRSQRRKASIATAGLVALMIAGCTGDRSPAGDGPAQPNPSLGSSASPSASAAPSAEPLPAVSGSLDGMAAARAVLRRPDVRPEYGWLSKHGHLLVTWRIMQRGAPCRAPEVVTWVSYEGWRHGIRQAHVRAWLLETGQRTVSPAGPGFLLEPSSCRAHNHTGTDRPLLINGHGRILRTRLAHSPAPPKQGMLSTGCSTITSGAPRRGLCQLDPESGRMWRLAKPHYWSGPWDDATSILGRPSSHISGTWSVNGGATWHQTWDPWDATVARWAGETYLFSNSMAGSRSPTSPVYRLPASVDLRFHPHGVGPPDLIKTGIVLPRSTDGYRRWQLTDEGVLLGTTNRPVIYVSRATDWANIIRRETEYNPEEVIGRFLLAQSAARSAALRSHRILRVSEDFGKSWFTIDLTDVHPQ